jgi:hypothetical protein
MIDEPQFLPPSVQDYVSQGHLARCGIYSSRRIAKACRERVDFMSIVALDPPDFRTMSDFRKRHLKAISGLFVQVLCENAGLVKLGSPRRRPHGAFFLIDRRQGAPHRVFTEDLLHVQSSGRMPSPRSAVIWA